MIATEEWWPLAKPSTNFVQLWLARAYLLYRKQPQRLMNVSEAISTIETLGGYKFVRRYKHFNLDTNRGETAYVFTSANGQWEHDTTFDCLGQLRFYARQFQYTHRNR